MNSGVVKKTTDIVLKNTARKRLKAADLRRTRIAGAGLHASEGININRIASFIRYKCQKNIAMVNYGMKLDNFESVKERALFYCTKTEAKAAIVASETIRKYASGIVTEVISDSTFKASKVLNWWGGGGNKRRWGSIADLGFKPANRTQKLWGFEALNYDWDAHDCYVNEAFGVPVFELWKLANYAAVLFMIDLEDAVIIARQVIAVEKIVEASFQASQILNLSRNCVEKPTEHIQGEYRGESTVVVGEDEPLKECPTNFFDDIYISDESDDEREGWETKGHIPGFLESRDERCIFMDCKAAGGKYKGLMRMLSGSSVDMNWARMAKFMEFKARKEYAMETYGVKLGDFHSLKENALKLFQISEAQATTLASNTMILDSESICFEKIADAALKASKILNWVGGNKKPWKKWHGNIADASGFKSSKSMKNFSKNMDIEARKAYTMEAFGVSSVEIEYLKEFVIEAFYEYNSEVIKEGDAVIMACESVAVDHIVDAASKNLNLTLEMSAMEAEEARAMPVLMPPYKPGPSFIFADRHRRVAVQARSLYRPERDG